MWSKTEKLFHLFFVIGIVLFVLAAVWMNFKGQAFYNFDMYSDALVAEYMAEEGTLFPEAWVFGNQYYGFATPSLAALFCCFIHDGVFSIGVASCLMMELILAAFAWSLKPFVSKNTLTTGLFCIAGGVVLGSSASSYICGFQILYTMASYYACYVLVIIYTLGVFLRLQIKKCSWCHVTLCAVLNFMTAINSERMTLVLIIPLGIISIVGIIKRIKSVFLFGLYAFIPNVLGIIYARQLKVNSVRLRGTLNITLSIRELTENLRCSFLDLIDMSGLNLWKTGVRWIPLSVCAVFLWGIVIYAVVLVFQKKDCSPVGQAIWFSIISIGGVLFTGTFLMRTRPIYYFVWYLIVVYSVVYLLEKSQKKVKILIVGITLCCGIVSGVYNYYPDLKKYNELNHFYSNVAEKLAMEGIDFIYCDSLTPPAVAACSKGKIHSATFDFDYTSGEGAPLKAIPFLKPIDRFENIDYDHSYIVLSNGIYGSNSAFTNLSWGGEEYTNKVMSYLVPQYEETCSYTTLYMYKFHEGIME